MTDRHVLPGSYHEPHPYHQPHAKCHPDDAIEVTVWTSEPKTWAFAVANFARRHDLTALIDGHPSAYRLVGRVETMEAAFGVELYHLHHPDGGTYRGHLGPVSIPAELKDVVTGVFGLDQRPVAKPYHRPRGIRGGDFNWYAGQPKLPAGTFTPPQLAALYGFPTGATGNGQTIAIIELGGGYKPADLQAYFAELGISPAPSVSSVSVDGGTNAPTGDPNGPDGEVMLDIEVCGAIAPGARIVVYFAPNTDQGFMDAVARIMNDPVHGPSVISISWGGPEDSWTSAAMTQMDSIFAEGKAKGITVTVASGDSGSSDGESGNHVDFPASSPHVLACGGTTVKANGGVISSEVVWNDDQGDGGGGGYSTVFKPPYYQPSSFKGRGVPDVCGDADPATGWYVRVDGQDTVFGGTSAVAPMWAALIALSNQVNGQRAGFVNGALSKHQAALNDITSGNNGAYKAGPGWDACTGWGSPKGAAVVAALKY